MHRADMLPQRDGGVSGERLVCGPNWLGDGIMAMPAVERLVRREPDVPVTVLVRPHMAPLWSMLDGLQGVQTVRSGTSRTARDLRRAGFAEAFILPNSFRSAFVPLLAGIPRRRGAAGHWRRWMLTEVVAPARGGAPVHQAEEVARILDVADPAGIAGQLPRLAVPESARRECEDLLHGATGPVVLFPGAARGASKRWPVSHFETVGRRLACDGGVPVVVAGSEAERPLCEALAAGIGPGASSLAGRASLPVTAALLQQARCVVGNDSGGVHLAAALGARVVVLFGLTDPRITRPLGQGHVILQPPGVAKAGRDIPRESAAAQSALAAIRPETVMDALHRLPGVL